MENINVDMVVLLSTIESIVDSNIKRNSEILKRLKGSENASGGENVYDVF